MDNNSGNNMLLTPQVAITNQLHSEHLQSVAQYDTESEGPNIRDYLHKLLKHKRWIIAVLATSLTLAVLLIIFMTPIYLSTATLQIMHDNASAIMGERDPMALLTASDSGILAKFYETQYIILESRPLAKNIIKAMNLQDQPEYKKLREAHPDESPREIENRYIGFFLSRLEIKPNRKSYLIDVSYKSADQEMARDVANAVAREYMRFSMTTRQQSYTMIREWLEGELHQLAIKVEASETKLFKHGQAKDFLSLEGDKNIIVEKFVELSSLLTKAESERAIKEAQFKQIKERGLDSPAITNNLLIQKVREETIAQEAKVASLNKIYDVNYPQLQVEQAKLKDMKLRLSNEVQRTRASIGSDYEAAVRAENLIRESLNAQKGQVANLQDNLVYHHILKRDMQTNEQLYQGLLARMKEASVASTMVASNVAVIGPAEFPLKPYRPRPMLYLAIAGFLGLLGGVGLALMVDRVDDSIKTGSEMEKVCHVPLLAMVPQVLMDNKDKNENSILIFDNPKSHLSESVYHLRSSVMLSSAGGPPPTIMVTSPNPSEGKTTISINLAASLALNFQKVVIVDADTRKPSIHKAFNHYNQVGLSNFITGNATEEEIIFPTAMPGLFFIPAGSIPPNPIEILTSKIFIDLINRLQREFSFVVIDTPPVIGFADARVISSIVTAVLMVIKQDSTSRRSGQLATQLLYSVNAKILGGVLNMIKKETLNYEGYGYSYYSKYYLPDDEK